MTSRSGIALGIMVFAAGIGTAAMAGERPTKGTSSGLMTSTCEGNVCTNHEEGTFIATHTGRGTFVSDSTSVFSTPFCGSTSGQTILTAANGDQVFDDFVDDFCFDGAVASYAGTFTTTGGTGRFSDVTGSGTISGTLDCSTVPCHDTTFAEGRTDY